MLNVYSVVVEVLRLLQPPHSVELVEQLRARARARGMLDSCMPRRAAPPSCATLVLLAAAAACADDAAVPPTDGGPGAGDATTDGAADGFASDARGDAHADAPDAGPGQAIAFPLYDDPSGDPAAWQQMNGAAPKVALLVANPASGPGPMAEGQYTQAIATTHAAGQTIVGYVHTSYANTMTRPVSAVEADVDAWYSYYPDIDGIFFDEVSTDTSTIAAYYQPLHDYVKGKAGQRVVVINPGTLVDEAFMATADIVVTFEDVYANYVSNYPPNPAWIANYPRWRFWHLVLQATSVGDMQNAVAIARGRNVGYVYVTDQPPASAYQTLASGAYWQAELAAVQ